MVLSSYAQEKHYKQHGRSKSAHCHQRSSSANFQKVYFGAPVHRESILNIIEGQTLLDSPKVIKCTFSKCGVLSFYTKEKHFKHHVRSKSGQGHQRSSSANFSKGVFLSLYAIFSMYRESILNIIGSQNLLDSPKVIKCNFSKSVAVLSSYAQGKYFKHHWGFINRSIHQVQMRYWPN